VHLRRRMWGGIVVLLGLVVWLLPGEVIAGEVAARGKGFRVMQSEIDQLVVEQKVLLRNMGRSVGAEEEALLEARTLDRLVVREILRLMATEEDQRVAREGVEAAIAEQKARMGSEDAYRRQILKSGNTVEDFERRLSDQAISDRVIEREIRSKVQVTDEQVRAFYDEGIDVAARELVEVVGRLEAEGRDTAFYRDATNRLAIIRQTNLDRLVRPEQARARLLVLFSKDPITKLPLAQEVQRSKKERLERLRKRVLDGEDFATLAAEFSEEPEAARNRGEYLATKAQLTLPELREALFTLPLNQVSGVITTDLGFYLVEVLERPPAGRVSLAEAEVEIRRVLIGQETEKRLPVWFEQLKRDYAVELGAN